MKNQRDKIRLYFNANRQVGLLTGFFILQLLFAFMILPLVGKKAVFPFSRWDLFTSLPKHQMVPLVYIHKVDSHVYQPPMEAHHFFRQRRGGAGYIEGHDYLQKEMQSLAFQETGRISADVVSKMAVRFFSGFDPVEFEVRRVELDSVDFFKRGEVLSSQSVGTYLFSDGVLREK